MFRLLKKENARPFSRVAGLFYISISRVWGCPFLSLALVIVHIYNYSHSGVCVKWYLMVILICISLMTNGVEHCFKHLFTIYLSSLAKCLFKAFAHFFNWMFVFSLGSLYILDTSRLPDTWFAALFSQSTACLFIFLLMTLKVQMF